MRNKLTSYIYELYDKGLLKEYSKKHLLIKVLNGEFDFFKLHHELINDLTYF
ncbi:hypothetical protein [Clostridium estertheticum]|uniref:hypothetical protein n=1 Tax=Clostridium estertheticum TaxID=238834 RepID=UPI001C0B6E4D|nr:hypothetical protein [Clostridium estertheticum]MBU3187208.1 hypothetical protein [Clostridium estertheticum]